MTNRTQDYLNRARGSACQRGQHGALPMASFAAAKVRVPSGVMLLKEPAAWTFIGQPAVKQRESVENELAAWKGGSYTAPLDFGFAT